MIKKRLDSRLMEKELLSAWENDEFDVFLQPQVKAETGEIHGFEALIRWRHPTRGILEPDKFLPAMENLCMVERLDYLAFEKVCAFLAGRMEADKGLFCIACNFVREHFIKEDFVESLEKIRESYGVPAGYLAVEMREGAAFSDEEAVQRNVLGLKECGFSVCLDDYGASCSSFGDLMFHSISHIKADKKLVEHIERENVQVVLQGLCAIAHRLSYEVVCEGVETREQLELVKKCGVDVIQGFYYYRPMMLSHAEGLYDSRISCREAGQTV